MKKVYITLAFLFAIVNIIKAQDCKCNPNGFNPFEYTYGGETIKIKDGNQFSAKCKSPIKLNGGYKCSYSTTICDVKFKATIKNSAGVVIKNYEEFSFPLNYEFETGGNFVLEITPYCAGKACPSAKFNFTVFCDTQIDCKCNVKNGWDELSTVLNGATNPTTCGNTFNIKKTDKFGLKGNYKCIGNCDVILKGTISSATSNYTQSFPSIRLDGEPLSFPGAGSYKLVITPVCNGKECSLCIFYVIVN